jgi:hypothetical protein
MSFNKSSIAENIREEVENLIELVSGEEAQDSTAYQMERQLLWKMLAVGRHLMQLFFAMRAETEKRAQTVEVEGQSYTYVGTRVRGYVAIFGKVEVKRACYWRRGQGSQYPLDEALSLPERSYSEWVQEIVEELSVCIPYEEAVGLLGKWFRLNIPKRSTVRMAGEHAAVVTSYYEQQPAPRPEPADTILAVLADGKGIPMNHQDSPPPQSRRGKGGKKTAKREATVTAIYTIAPYRRTADAVIQALLSTEAAHAASRRPSPTTKQVFGTLDGKAVAFEHLARQVAKRQTEQVFDRIALTDGNRALQLKVEEYLPDFTLILDIIHVAEYLWEAANALLGETHPRRGQWVEDALRCLLQDDHETLFLHLDYQRSAPGLAQRKVKTLTKVLNYLRRNQSYMDYCFYLSQGWPIGTGVIEGACRHLVKDRFEQAGMRWSLSGAQSMLDLRAVHLNGDWDDFQCFRRRLAHNHRYGTVHPMHSPEALVLGAAA